jgi:molecular chaperone GrpE (heat shock protein)
MKYNKKSNKIKDEVNTDGETDTTDENLGTKVTQLSEEILNLTQQLQNAKHKEQLALADYQNLVRRTSQDRGRLAKLAARNFVDDLIQPLSHLSLASDQLNDAGLTMVISQLWQGLEQNGLKKIDSKGKDFDVNTMEATESGENGKKVVKVVSEGYTLNEEVVQHAKVILD